MEISASRQDLKDLSTDIKGEIKELKTELKDSFDDITTLLQTFMQQVDERFNQVESKQSEDISKIFDYLDRIIKQQEISDEERLVMGHQLDRLDRWTHELAAKIGYKLTV